ncbi:hypothetical protein [Qipengyuania nanhaisediminis]|uniref:hypothetical protein n=1 Tax=Qipengyuania nanhaisediminis TaxID=604088 RepID=UPI0015A6455D|nr:hypothetical protein [Qipengyuania nanhaisediminis]
MKFFIDDLAKVETMADVALSLVNVRYAAEKIAAKCCPRWMRKLRLNDACKAPV